MGAAKIFKLFRKGAKAASRKAKAGKGEAPTWPPGVRVGIFGQANSGKTVYYTVLHEECKIGRDLQITVTDHATASTLLEHYRNIWGLSTAQGAGTVVDVRGEQKFPDPTEKEQVLIANAVLDGGAKMRLVMYEYNGKRVSLTESAEGRERVFDFMTGCDGILFFYDPKLLKAELQSQAFVASCIALLERLAPLNSSLPIPVGLVITKADLLPGFSGENQVVLIPPESEHWLAGDVDTLLESVLADERVAKNATWAGTVREVLVTLRELLKAVVGRTLDFQVFFVSATGQTPEKVGADVGRSIYVPPRKLTPVGIKTPLYWLLRAVRKNRRLTRFRKTARWVALLAAVWVIAFSLPYLYHLHFLLPRLNQVEQSILKIHEGDVFTLSSQERNAITSAYRRYESNKIVQWLYPSFVAPARTIRGVYTRFSEREALAQLDKAIARFAAVVADSTAWPHVKPGDSTLVLSDTHQNILQELQRFHRGDSTTTFFLRSGRALQYWELFTRAIAHRDDTTYWKVIKQQVQQDRNLYAKELSKAEQQLGDALLKVKLRSTRRVVAQQTAYEFDEQIIPEINDNPDPKFRLVDAVRRLRRIQAKLSPSDRVHQRMIRDYLRDARRWSRTRTYEAKIIALPGQGHLHVEVTDPDSAPQWTELNQIFEGDAVTLQWKSGQVIHLALDTLGHPCQRGRDAADKVVLTGPYSIFEMDGDITFPNVKKTVTIQFVPPLRERLPKLEAGE